MMSHGEQAEAPKILRLQKAPGRATTGCSWSGHKHRVVARPGAETSPDISAGSWWPGAKGQPLALRLTTIRY
jgi:hypothetical protein